MSESRVAAPPQVGHLVFTQSVAAARGDCPFGFRSKPLASGSKSGKYQGTVIREKHVSMDPQFYDNKDSVLYDAQLAKYTQNGDLRKILLSTLNAKLIYHAKGSRPEVSYDLMIVREEMIKGTKIKQ